MKDRRSIKKIFSAEILTHFRVERNANSLAIPVNDRNGNELDQMRIKVRLRNSAVQSFEVTQSVKKRSFNHSEMVSALLYNWDSIPCGRQHLVVTLDIPAVWKFWESGFPDVLGLLRKEISESELAYISSVVKRDGIVCVVTDGDIPALRIGAMITGRLAACRLAYHKFCISKKIVNLSPGDIRGLFSD